MSPVTIRLRRTVTHADHTRVQAQDRAAAVAVHTRAAEAVDHRLTVAQAVLHRTVELVEVTANRNHLPAIASGVKPLMA
jgi:hypothetical protein